MFIQQRCVLYSIRSIGWHDLDQCISRGPSVLLTVYAFEGCGGGWEEVSTFTTCRARGGERPRRCSYDLARHHRADVAELLMR